MVSGARRSRLLRTTADLSGTDLVLLQLDHAPESGHASLADASETTGELDNSRLLELAEWIYLHVEEVWSGFNLVAEAVAKGFEVRARFKKDQRRIDQWNDLVHVEDKVRMWVKNALVYGRCVMEAGDEFLKVRNPRTIRIDQDDRGRVTKVTQESDAGERDIPADRVHVFTLHRLFSDDLAGISAIQPILQTIDDQLGVRRVNRALQRRYRAPIRLIEMPADATDPDRQAVQRQLEETPPDMDLVLPPGAKMHVLNHGNDPLPVDALMRDHFTDRIFMGLGIPKIALGIPDGSNRSVSETQRKLLLAEKVVPYQRQVRQFARGLYEKVLGAEVEVSFAPVDARDDKAIADVSKTLVEAGIKTAEQVEEYYWEWGAA